MSDTTKLLDTNLRTLFEDRKLVDHVIRSIQLDQGCSYIEALESLHKGSDSARNSHTPTLRAAVEWAGSEPDYVADSVKLLERRDAAVQEAYEQAAGPIMLDQTDSRGLVLLDQPSRSAGDRGNPVLPSARAPEPIDPNTTDIGTALGDPAEFERRLARIRKAQPRFWDGDEGRARFKTEDRVHLENGKDMVRSAERDRELAAARGKAQAVAQKLDRAITDGADKRQKLKLLDAEIAKLEGPAARVRETAREQLRSEMKAASQDTVRMLDQLGAAGKVAEPGSTPSTDVLYEQAHERMRLLDRGPGEFMKTVYEILDGAPPPEPKQDAPAVPPGVHPGPHMLDAAIRARMEETGESYIKTLEHFQRRGEA